MCQLVIGREFSLSTNVTKDNILTTTISLKVSFFRKNEMIDYFFVMS